MMVEHSQKQDWRPSTPPLSYADFDAYPIVVVHYWAIWDRPDRDMDQRLLAVRDSYAGRICFRSCDTDRPENPRFVYKLVTIPALGCFIHGRFSEFLIGLRAEDQLRSQFDKWLTDADARASQPSLQQNAPRRGPLNVIATTIALFLLLVGLCTSLVTMARQEDYRGVLIAGLVTTVLAVCCLAIPIVCGPNGWRIAAGLLLMLALLLVQELLRRASYAFGGK